VHYRFSFAAELVESKSRITLSLCRLTALLPGGAAWRGLIRLLRLRRSQAPLVAARLRACSSHREPRTMRPIGPTAVVATSGE